MARENTDLKLILSVSVWSWCCSESSLAPALLCCWPCFTVTLYLFASPTSCSGKSYGFYLSGWPSGGEGCVKLTVPFMVHRSGQGSTLIHLLNCVFVSFIPIPSIHPPFPKPTIVMCLMGIFLFSAFLQNAVLYFCVHVFLSCINWCHMLFHFLLSVLSPHT